jgi:hypothetical protein
MHTQTTVLGEILDVGSHLRTDRQKQKHQLLIALETRSNKSFSRRPAAHQHVQVTLTASDRKKKKRLDISVKSGTRRLKISSKKWP